MASRRHPGDTHLAPDNTRARRRCSLTGGLLRVSVADVSGTPPWTSIAGG